MTHLLICHNHYGALGLKRQNQGRLPFFLAYVAFGFFNSRNTGGFLNTRKVFFEYHNVPMDTLKVITALVQWGSCGSPSVIHNREVLVRALFVPRGTNRVGSVKASRTVGVGVTSHYSHLLNSTLHMPPQASFV
ncbi:unnamed protein product [Prunus armeniaca]|uniref:Uncharacterized protein n=1 Tax=Prunus armeniaca TaxID=36596 RepID=A0A6J5W5V4_PRUAR|nr:unnamed protein product [Prunus armeniaca]